MISAYLRFFWRWLCGLVPVFWHGLTYHRLFPQSSQGLLRDIVTFQVQHWRDFTLLCLLRHRASQYLRRYHARLQRLRKKNDKSVLKR